VLDNSLTYNPNTNYIIYNVTDLIQTTNTDGELIKISSDTSSNANAILFTKEQYPNFLPTDSKYCIFTNSAEENRILRTFNTIFGNTDCTHAISDIKAEDVNKNLDKTSTILAENIKLWHLKAEMEKASKDDVLVSDTIKSLIK
jgi:hypothetical protein